MATLITSLGDKTSREVKPDFESGKAYYWMKQTRAAREAGTQHRLPRKPRRGKAQESFSKQVDARLSRSTFTVNIAFDEHGKRIHDEDIA